MSPAAVSYWETGATKSIRLDHFFALADVLECSPRWLATGAGAPDPELGTREDRDVYDAIRTLDPGQRAALLALLKK